MWDHLDLVAAPHCVCRTCRCLKKTWGSTYLGKPPQGPGALVGRGAARVGGISQSASTFSGPALFLALGYNLVVWVGVTRPPAVVLVSPSLPGSPCPFSAPEWVSLPCPGPGVALLPASCLSSGPLPQPASSGREPGGRHTKQPTQKHRDQHQMQAGGRYQGKEALMGP